MSKEIIRCPNCNQEVEKESEHFVDGYTPYEHDGWRCKKKDEKGELAEYSRAIFGLLDASTENKKEETAKKLIRDIEER